MASSSSSTPTPYAVEKDATNESETTCINFTVSNGIGALQKCLQAFSNHGIDLNRIESKPSVSHHTMYDFYVEFVIPSSEDMLNHVVSELQQHCAAVSVLGRSKIAQVPWFPQRINDLDKFTHKVLAYGSELAADHPGFTDEDYRARRRQITELCSGYKHGIPIPRIEYTELEIQTWGVIYNKLKALYATNACKQHRHVFPLLEQSCGYSADNIPQLQEVSNFLKRGKKECTGWTLRPVSGLLSPRDFLNGLAFRVFHSTQYIRHHSKPFYTPEPDVCHELLGHVPLFADPEFADFSQEIGVASLGASDDDVEKLATVYWFTVEFGLCKEGNDIKAYGAGLLSSFGELEHCLSEIPQKVPFDPFFACKTKYPITEYQPLYFVAESFNIAKRQIREFARSLDRPFEIFYNPLTQSVEVLDSKEKIAFLARQIQSQMTLLTNALTR